MVRRSTQRNTSATASHKCLNALEMSVLTFAPLLLAGVLAGGAFALSRNAYPENSTAEAIVRRAEAAIEKSQRGFQSDQVNKQVRFEIDVLKSMLVNVPEESKETAQRSIDKLTVEVEKQAQAFVSKKLLAEVASIDQALSTSGITSDEIGKIRARLEGMQKLVSSLSAAERQQASSTLTSLFSKVDHVDKVQQDRETLSDIRKSLKLPNTQQEKARMRGTVYEIIQRFGSSSISTRQDRQAADEVAKQIEADITSPEVGTKIGTSSYDQLRAKLDTEKVWSQKDLEEAEKLLLGVPDVSKAAQLKSEIEVRKQQIALLMLPKPPAVVSQNAMEAALNLAGQMASQINHQVQDPIAKARMVSKLAEYVKGMQVSKCKDCPNPKELDLRIQELARKLGVTSTYGVNATSTGSFVATGPISTQISTLTGMIGNYDLLKQVEVRIQELDTQIDLEGVDEAVKQKNRNALVDARSKLNTNMSKHSDRLKRIAAKYFEKTGTGYRANRYNSNNSNNSNNKWKLKPLTSGVTPQMLIDELEPLSFTGNAGNLRADKEALLQELKKVA